ncbi:MAG: phosphatidate cytidylyltransferase [Flavobacteriales bacterium]|jgi:phosphatidate cytidylyltransferase|nr:phosphatidate cytidylyltransferase [Flavobacteriales bacterium]
MKKMPELATRIIVGLIAFGIFLFCIFTHQVGFLVFFGFTLIVGLMEFYNLIDMGGFKPQRLTGYILGITMFLGNGLMTFYDYPQKFLLFPLLCLFLILPIELYRKREHPFTNIAHGLLGIIYVAIPVTLLINIVHPNDEIGYNPLFFVGWLMLILSSDSGAYLAGTAFGKHKLFERISPKKSWEGAIGGLLMSVAFAVGFSYFLDFLTVWEWIGLSVISVVAGIYGDLVESLLKRNVGAKDSGTLLPGHGGVLDRLDSIVLATPFAFVYLKIFL